MPIGDDFGLVALTTAIYKATDVLQQSVDAVADSQKTSAALGRTFEFNGGGLTESVKKLDGTITQRLSVAFEALNQGVNLNSVEVLKLAEFQKITNQDSKKTLQLFATLEKQLNFSNIASENLAITLVESSKKYGVSTEYLVESLSSFIDANKEILNITKLADPVVNAMAEVQSQLGPNLSKELNKFMGVLYSAGSENLSVINNLGLASIRQQLAFATTAEEQKRLQLEALRIAGERITSFSNQYGSNLTAAGDALKAQFGDLGGVTKSLFDELNESSTRVVDTQKLFYDINQRLLKALDPLRESFFKLVAANEDLIDSVIKLIQAGVNYLQDKFEALGSEMEKYKVGPQKLFSESILSFAGILFASIGGLKSLSSVGTGLGKAVTETRLFRRGTRRLFVTMGRASQGLGKFGSVLGLLGGTVLKGVLASAAGMAAIFAKVLIVAGILYGVFIGIKNAINNSVGGFENLRERMQPVLNLLMSVGELLFTFGQVIGKVAVNIGLFFVDIFGGVYDMFSGVFNAISDMLGGFLGNDRVTFKDTFEKMTKNLEDINSSTGISAEIALADSAARKSELATIGAEGTGTAAIIKATKIPKAVSDLISGFREDSISYKYGAPLDPNTKFLTREEFLEAIGSLSGKKELDLLVQIFDANTKAAYEVLGQSKDINGFLDRIRLQKAIAAVHSTEI